MNFDDSVLVQSNPQLHLKPETELEFADFLINQAMDAAFCLGAKAQFLYVNDATCRLSEYSREELLAMTLQDICIDFSLDDWLEKWQYLKNKASLTFESRCRTKGGRIFWLEITILYQEHQGREFGCAFARQKSNGVNKFQPDVKKEFSAVSQQKEKQVQFISMVCHQLRTPLNVVSFSNSLLKRHLDEWTREKTQSLLSRIQVSVEQINQLLDDILFFAKAEAAKLNFEPKPLDIVDFCHDLVELMQASSNKNRINFISQGNCFKAYMDEKLLEPILKNLLDNAINYSPDGCAIDFKISCQAEKVIFQVHDQGIGISSIDRQRLFEPFYRRSHINHIPGAGLGLSIVKALVDLHKGQIAVESDVNVGNTFTVILPLVT